MTLEQVRQAVQSVPFKPFRLWISEQYALTVAHPEYLFAPPGTRTIVVADEKGFFHWVDAIHITRLEELEIS